MWGQEEQHLTALEVEVSICPQQDAQSKNTTKKLRNDKAQGTDDVKSDWSRSHCLTEVHQIHAIPADPSHIIQITETHYKQK